MTNRFEKDDGGKSGLKIGGVTVQMGQGRHTLGYRHVEHVLPFDPTTGFHEYRFDYSQDSVTFFVDGIQMRSWDTGIPQTSMHLMVNSWFPAWLEGRNPKKTTYTYVDWMGYESQPPAG